MKTWKDIEQAALTDPVLHTLVTLARHGDLSKEQALIQIVFWMTEERELMLRRISDLLQQQPFPHHWSLAEREDLLARLAHK